MLMELKNYLASRREVSVHEVAAHFDISPETARGMLEHWVCKGKASRLSLEQCRQCVLHCGKSWEAYQWLDQEILPAGEDLQALHGREVEIQPKTRKFI
jgi:hypothetical protein